MGRKSTWKEKDALLLIEELNNWLNESNDNVFVKDFIHHCDETKYPGKVYSDIFQYLSKRYDSFKKEYDRCKEIEELKIVKNGLNSNFNATMSKFVLSAKYGWKEQTETTTNTNIKLISIDPFLSDDLEDND